MVGVLCVCGLLVFLVVVFVVCVCFCILSWMVVMMISSMVIGYFGILGSRSSRYSVMMRIIGIFGIELSCVSILVLSL